jgi:hypothetical protein
VQAWFEHSSDLWRQKIQKYSEGSDVLVSVAGSQEHGDKEL